MKKFLVWSLFLFATAAGAAALNLPDCIDLANKNNPSVIAAQKKADAAAAKLNQALSAFFPTVSLNGNYDQSHSTPATFQFTSSSGTQQIQIGTDATASITGVQTSLSQPLYVPSLFPEYGIAKKSADYAAAEYQQTRIDSSFNVTQTYFGVLLAKKLANLMEDSLNMARSHREQVQSMLKAGMSTKSDFLSSKVREANASVALIQSKYNIDLAKDSFNNALGNDIRQSVDLEEAGFTGKVERLPEFDALLAQAFENRPDWQGYLLSRGISEDQVSLSRSDYFPNVLLNANIGNQLTQYPTFQSNVNSWKITGSGSWTLFDSLARENRVQEASENLAAQDANLQLAKNNIALEVHAAYLNLRSALDVVVSSLQAVESAEESHKVATSRYNSGLGTNVDVLDSQVDLTSAKTDYLQALFDVEIAKAKINKAVGKTVI